MAAAAENATAQIVDYALAIKPSDLPAAVRKEGLRSFFNVLGCTLGGARHDVVDKTWTALQPFAGAEQVTLIGRGARTDAITASLINTMSSTVASNDDTHAEAIVHPSGPVMAAVLAVAERQQVSGRDLLTAFILGVEVICRLSKAVSVAPAKGKIAWSQTGITCGIGAALAAAKLMGLDAGQTRQALGHAGTQAAGLRAAHGSMGTFVVHALSSQTGLRAAYLAGGGITSTDVVFEHRYGFHECFAQMAHPEHLTGGLGERFEILANTYKPFPCGIVINPLVDAALQMRADHKISAGDVERIAMQCNPGALALCDRRHPKDEVEGQVSLYHWVAASMMRGKAGLGEGTDATIHDPALKAFRERVFATANPEIPIDGVDMTITLKGGRTLEKKLRDCIGSKGNPMTDAQLEAKFAEGASRNMPAARVQALIAQTWKLEQLADASTLVRMAS